MTIQMDFNLNTSNVINKLNFQRKMEKEKEYLNTSNVINKRKFEILRKWDVII